MSSRQIKTHCAVDQESAALLETAIEKLGLSARAYNRILKIARTIADLAHQPQITTHHIAEAIFKGLARALRRAIEIDPRKAGEVPSTKGKL